MTGPWGKRILDPGQAARGEFSQALDLTGPAAPAAVSAPPAEVFSGFLSAEQTPLSGPFGVLQRCSRNLRRTGLDPTHPRGRPAI